MHQPRSGELEDRGPYLTKGSKENEMSSLAKESSRERTSCGHLPHTPRDSGATQPSQNVPPSYFPSLPEEVMSKERAETDLYGQAVATNEILS